MVSQDRAKKSLAVAVYNHYKRINADTKNDDVEVQKSNILMLGPTGSGNPISPNISQDIECSFAIADATSLTEAGYVGRMLKIYY